MEILINTPGQTFYYSTIQELMHHCEQKNNCAVILLKEDAKDFIEQVKDRFKTCISQLIVIGDNVNEAVEQTKNYDTLIISASNLQDAIQIALNSSNLCKDVICVSK